MGIEIRSRLRTITGSDLADLARPDVAMRAARELFPAAPQPWIDLASGRNPIAYPIAEIPADAWVEHPDPAAIDALETLAARRYGAPPGCAAVSGPGTRALISRLPAICDGPDVRCLSDSLAAFGPVFGNRPIRGVPHQAALAGADVALVLNPNPLAPTPLVPQDLLSLAEQVGLLIVDEAYVDASTVDASVVPFLSSQRMIVLRSFAKAYGLAGVRLGFALTRGGRADALRRLVGPASLAGPSVAIASRALTDTAWLQAMRVRLERDATRLMFLLRAVGATPIGGTPLYALVRHPAAGSLCVVLAEAGLLTRPFPDRDWLRIAVPGPPDAWARLEAALRTFHDL